MKPPRVAVIDIGSNTIKVLVAEKGDPVRELARHTCEVRISTGLGDDRPYLHEPNMQAAIEAVQFLLDKATPHRPDRIQIVATSAVRDACNGAEFEARLEEATGHPLRVLTGDVEANGIARGAAQDPALQDFSGFLLADLGGGSLEVILREHGVLVYETSLPLGAVRLAERCLADLAQPVSSEEQATIQQHVTSALAAAEVPVPPSGTPLVIAGGAMTFARMLLAAQAGLRRGELSPAITPAALAQLTTEVCALDRQARERLEGLPANRADIFPVALLTLVALARHVEAEELRHTFYNLRWGIADELLADL